MDEEAKKVIKVPVRDKRRLAREGDKVADETPGVTSREDGGQVLMDESSSVEQQPVPAPGEAPGDHAVPNSASHGATSPDGPQLSVDELQHLKADLENTRKRMIREQSRALEYATKDVMKKMIPVIDHFRLAIEHGEGGNGIEMALKELLDVLASEGLEEIEVSEGTPFDPAFHHALATHSDPQVEVDTVKQVHRGGFRFKDHILRAPEVLVAQPVEEE
jgi:molecular chaperone GrpE